MVNTNGAHSASPFNIPAYLNISTMIKIIKSRIKRLVNAGKMIFSGVEYIFAVNVTCFTKSKFEAFLQAKEQPAHRPAIYKS